MKSTNKAMDITNKTKRFFEYMEHQTKEDPKFYNWLFGPEAYNIKDYGVDMTNEQTQAAANFFLIVKNKSEAVTSNFKNGFATPSFHSFRLSSNNNEK